MWFSLILAFLLSIIFRRERGKNLMKQEPCESDATYLHRLCVYVADIIPLQLLELVWKTETPIRSEMTVIIFYGELGNPLSGPSMNFASLSVERNWKKKVGNRYSKMKIFFWNRNKTKVVANFFLWSFSPEFIDFFSFFRFHVNGYFGDSAAFSLCPRLC